MERMNSLPEVTSEGATFAAPDPVLPRARYSAAAIVSFIIAVATVFGYLAEKTLLPIYQGPDFAHSWLAIATVFGTLSLASILPIAAIIVFGHASSRATARDRRGRVLAIAATTVGYVLLAMYINRIVVSLIAMATVSSAGTLIQNNFYWL